MAGTRTFVGRGTELARLAEAYAAAEDGRGGVVLIDATGGLGASRLLDESLRRLAATTAPGQGPLVLRSDALPAWRGRPFEPLRYALGRELRARQPAEVASILEPGIDALRPLLPEAFERSGLADRPAPVEHRTERTLEAIRSLIGRMADSRPVILVVEDLHVSDAGTRSAMAFLARTLGDRPVLIVGSFRHDALIVRHPLRATLEAIEDGAASVTRMRIPAFDQSELARLIELHEGERPSAPLLLLVAERSAGVPLVAEEVLAARRELSTASLTVPLDQLVRARASRRSPACRLVLRSLALADGPLPAADLGYLAGILRDRPGEQALRRLVGSPGHGMPAHAPSGARPERADPLDGELKAGLAEALESGFVVRQDGGRSAEPSYRIRHDMIADALAADLLPPERRRMHAAIASRAWFPADALGHALAARDLPASRSAALAAAALAEGSGAAADALPHLELVIELDAEMGAADPALLLRAADAAAAARDLQRAAAFVEASLALPATLADRQAAAMHWEKLANVRWEAGDREGAMAAYERARTLTAHGATIDRARVLARIAQVQMLAGSFTPAERLANEALDLVAEGEAALEADAADAASDAATDKVDAAAGKPEATPGPAADPRLALTLVRGHLICTLGVIDGWTGNTTRSIERIGEALRIAEAAGAIDDTFRARANLATILSLVGRRADAVDVAMAGIAAAEKAGTEDLHGNMLRGQATDFLYQAGRWKEARQIALRALSWIPSGHPYVSVAAYFLVLDAETTYGASAPRVLSRLLLELETVADAQAAIIANLARVSMALWRGDTADARRSVEIAWNAIRETEDWVLQGRTAASALMVAAEIAVAALDRRDMGTLASVRVWAESLLIEAERLVARSASDPDSFPRRETAAELATARAHRARAAGRDDPATWGAVAATWRDLGRRYDLALARWREGGALLDAAAATGTRREGRESAREPLLEAARIAAELGAVPLLQAVHDLADRGRVTLPRELFDALRPPDDAAATPESAVRDNAARSMRTFTAPQERPGATPETFGLSNRERGVLAEIVAGRTNKEIGERLFISEKTVGVHVGNILAKLGVAGRVEAATVAIRLGLVDDLAVVARRSTRSGSAR